MAISECPSRETYLAADISLIVENHGVIFIPKYSNPQNLSSAHLISGLLRPAVYVLSLGSGFRPMRILGKRGQPNRKPCLEGLRHDCGGFVDRASGLLSLGSVPGGRIRAGCAQNPS